jgi:hypothetical protein
MMMRENGTRMGSSPEGTALDNYRVVGRRRHDGMEELQLGPVQRRDGRTGVQPTKQNGTAALTDEICSDGAASSEETAQRWCSVEGGLQGPKIGSGAVAELL